MSLPVREVISESAACFLEILAVRIVIITSVSYPLITLRYHSSPLTQPSKHESCSASSVPTVRCTRSSNIVFKAALAKITHGLLVGIGFAAVIGGLMFGYVTWQMSKFDIYGDDMADMFKAYTPDAGLAITEHRPQRPTANDSFIGTLTNSGKDTWESVKIVTEMFSTDRQFVDKCSSYLDGSIAPGQTRNFKVSCAGCRDISTPLTYDKYTIAVVDASYVRPEKSASK